MKELLDAGKPGLQPKPRMLLLLSSAGYGAKVAVAATLAWLAADHKHLFDLYLDSHHLGVHFQGGDWRELETGHLTGGTVCGGRHFQDFYFLLLNCDVSVVTTGDNIFSQSVRNLRVPVISCCDRLNLLYTGILRHFDAARPEEIVMIGTGLGSALAGLDSYLYPEIFHRRALGVTEETPDDDLAEICGNGAKIRCVLVSDKRLEQLRGRGYEIEIVDRLLADDTYDSATRRIALRWKHLASGWIIGDPTLVAHWVPAACEQNLLSMYGIPQEKAIAALGSLIDSRSKVVLGRQYSDRDFFQLSEMNQALQVIDPCRPPFPSVRHIEHPWRTNHETGGIFAEEYSDEQLRQFAAEGRVLISLMFWSGMIREVENFHSLLDLFAITGLKCGVAVTAQTYEYMMHAPLELITIPVDQGGVYPNVEPLLGSCGIGVGIESLMSAGRLSEDLSEAMSRIRNRVKHEAYAPRGWWPTMDTCMSARNWLEKPKPVRFLRYSPYFQMRFHLKERHWDGTVSESRGGAISRTCQRFAGMVKNSIRRSRFMRHFEPYRPYEFSKPDSIEVKIIEAVKSAGLQYMFTKAGFNQRPAPQYLDDSFVALNTTAGQWDGWTPFETVNDVTDLHRAEKRLLSTRKPGWITSTVDSCLWTFSGEWWKRGSRLYEIASFCSRGGRSGRLINVKPITLSRYARIIAASGT